MLISKMPTYLSDKMPLKKLYIKKTKINQHKMFNFYTLYDLLQEKMSPLRRADFKFINTKPKKDRNITK